MPATHKFQSPKGTRDFYPEAMAGRRHLESVWREVSIRYGFDEIEGPTFEHLELYTLKSGPGIESELFSFRRAGGEADYALRPEFTPTMARMAAAVGKALPRPTKWFSLPSMFRAERPQRGRLREHVQWNADIVGDPSARAEAEIVAVTVAMLEQVKLTPQDVRVRISHRAVVSGVLRTLGVAEADLGTALALLDRRAKLTPAEFAKRAREQGIAVDELDRRLAGLAGSPGEADGDEHAGPLAELWGHLEDLGVAHWCDPDLSVVRGLAYYTGAVFEVHDTGGRERAIAGGGRYDDLIELFGGPSTPAVGIAMGDVVITLLLEEKNLLEPGAAFLPRPDAWVINACDDDDRHLRLVYDLRRCGLHVRHSYRATRNVGKLLGEAGSARARFAVIVGRELDEGMLALKDLASGEQVEVPADDIAAALRSRLRPRAADSS